MIMKGVRYLFFCLGIYNLGNGRYIERVLLRPGVWVPKIRIKDLRKVSLYLRKLEPSDSLNVLGHV